MQPDASADERRVVVAMSGGVDSCASALMLSDEGYSVIGIAMQVWDYRKNGGNAGRATCCAPTDFDDARGIAAARDFPFYVFDFEDSFYDAVIGPFVGSYLRGETPNPCLECNRKVKFHALRSRAAALGAETVATGHYAQVKPTVDGRLALFTAVDTEKDQSYFLYELTEHELERTIFPVGGMRKDDVRAYLGRHGFRVAKKPESQDICFVSSNAAEFIAREAPEPPEGGDLVSSDGTVLGAHGGIHRFTIGQRRGLGISGRDPLYVINIDPGSRRVTVGSRDELARESFTVRDVHWIHGEPAEPIRARVKLRYRHDGVECKIVPGGSTATLRFVSDWSAVTPGQAAVFYTCTPDASGSYQVLGGGRIARDPVA